MALPTAATVCSFRHMRRAGAGLAVHVARGTWIRLAGSIRLDGLLENDTLVRPLAHTTDTHGFTEQLFGLCHPLGCWTSYPLSRA